MPSRRQLILGAGAASVALVGAGTAWTVTRAPTSALGPWTLDATPPRDVRLDAFRHAILAPNPHNRQPWLIRLVGEDEAVITCDLDKRLPETDPFDRQIVIGFGAFVELAVLAATQRGVRVEVAAFPEGGGPQRLDGRPVARLKFIADPTVKTSPLASAILTRRTVKEPFDVARPLGDAEAAALLATAPLGQTWTATRATAQVGAITKIAIDAWQLESRTRRTMKESTDLMRIGAREIDLNPDGIALKGPMIEALRLVGMLSRDSLLDPASSAFKAGEKRYETMIGSTASHAWLVSVDGSRTSQLNAGRAYMRFTLEAARLGLAVHPISQALQEFPEMAPHYQAIHKALAIQSGNQLQMLVRIGYGPHVQPAPRWPLAKSLKAG